MCQINFHDLFSYFSNCMNKYFVLRKSIAIYFLISYILGADTISSHLGADHSGLFIHLSYLHSSLLPYRGGLLHNADIRPSSTHYLDRHMLSRKEDHKKNPATHHIDY